MSKVEWCSHCGCIVLRGECSYCGETENFHTDVTTEEMQLNKVRKVLKKFEGMLGCDYIGDELLLEVRTLREELGND